MFAPFGMANPKPVFVFEKVVLREPRFFGKENAHLELTFENSSVKAIMFFAEDEKYKTLSKGDEVDVIATMDLNTFRGSKELRLRIVDIIKKA